MSEATYGLASSLFFIGYALFEVPSALAAHRFGARLWFARILLTWGVLTVAARLHLHRLAFRRGAFSGRRGRSRRLSRHHFLSDAVVSETLPGAGGRVADHRQPARQHVRIAVRRCVPRLNGMFGLAGWQWVFIATGAPAIILFVLILRYLPDNPQKASFLKPAEKAWLADRTRPRRNRPDHSYQSAAGADRPAGAGGFRLVYIMITLSLYGIIYWLPTVVKGFGVTGTQNGLLNALPWAVAAVVLAWLPRHLREHRTVLSAWRDRAVRHGGVLHLDLVTENWMRYVALAVGTPCVSLLFPCIWYLPSQIFKGAHAAAAIAAISTIGSLGGFAAQNLMPWVAQWTGSAVAAMSVPAGASGAVGGGRAGDAGDMAVSPSDDATLTWSWMPKARQALS